MWIFVSFCKFTGKQNSSILKNWNRFSLSIAYGSIFSAQIRRIGDAPLKDLLRYYGGWPLLERNWKMPNQSLEEMLGKMHGELNEHFLVSVLVAPDDKNSSVNILVVSSVANCNISWFFLRNFKITLEIYLFNLFSLSDWSTDSGASVKRVLP